jgi:hypothetical protein
MKSYLCCIAAQAAARGFPVEGEAGSATSSQRLATESCFLQPWHFAFYPSRDCDRRQQLAAPHAGFRARAEAELCLLIAVSLAPEAAHKRTADIDSGIAGLAARGEEGEGD